MTSFLGGGEPCPEDYQGGRKLLLEEPEFLLFAYWFPRPGRVEIEWSPTVQTAYLKAFGRIIDGRHPEHIKDAAKLFYGLRKVNDYAEQEISSPGSGECSGQIAKILADTIGNRLAAAATCDPSKVLDLQIEINSLFASAVNGFLVSSGLKPDGRTNGKAPNVLALFFDAEWFILMNTRRPSKPELTEMLIRRGFDFPKKNRKRDWGSLFDLAGFGTLPDNFDGEFGHLPGSPLSHLT